MQTVLPDSWVDELFARIAIRYGAAWTAMWGALDANAVKSDWCAQLSGLTNQAIRYGIVNLPVDRPPNAVQFKAICLRAPREEERRLTHDRPPADLKRLAAELSRIPDLQRKNNPHKRAWAERLRERERNGEELTDTQRIAWRNTLREAPPSETTVSGWFNPIPPECLPPGGLRPEP